MAKRSRGLITYRSNGVVVTISHDFNRSYELSLFVGQEDPPAPMFDFGVALRSCNAPAGVPSSYQVSDEARLPKFVGELAGSLRSYCSDLLVGETQAFRQLEELFQVECDAFERERKSRYARGDADQAWSARDYQQVVDVLDPHEASLGKVEKRKLELARKKVARCRRRKDRWQSPTNLFSTLDGRSVTVVMSDPWGLGEFISWKPLRCVVWNSRVRREGGRDGTRDAILLRLKEPFTFDDLRYEYLLGSPKHQGSSLGDLRKGGTGVACGFLRIPPEQLDKPDPFDFWWRGGGGGLIATLSLD